MLVSRTYLSRAKKIYRRAMAPFGVHKVRRMLADGLPHTFARPLEFLFEKRLTPIEEQAASNVERIRGAVARLSSTFEVRNRDGEVCELTAANIAGHVSVDREWGTFLYLCAQSFKARTILELGSCAGISGCYLASSKDCETFITVEASPDLASLARANILQVSNAATILNTSFDDALDGLLPTLSQGLDLIYLDGHHKYEATLHYFRRLEPHLNDGAFLVFDDVHLSAGMWQAWQVLKAHRGFAYTIDAGRFGICLRQASSTPVYYDLRRYLGWIRNVSTFTQSVVPRCANITTN